MDAGTDTATYGAVSVTDFDGSERVIPASIDIGCYENPKSDVECGFVFASSGYLVPTEIEFTGVAFGFAETPDFTWVVTKDDIGSTEYLYGAAPTWTASEAGVYSVRLTVSGAEGSASYEMASCIKLAPADMYTSPGNESAAYPYSTPETAAPSIATAVAAAVDGTTIHVLKGADGIYPQSATIKVEKGVRIIGETGNPNDIVCTNLVVNVDKHGIFLLNHPDAFLAGLTLANGSLKANYSDGACLRIKPSGGTVSNCVICSGQSQHFDSQGAGAYVQAGIVTHTRFTGRFTSCPAYNANPTSKGVVAHLTGGRLENCLFHDIEIAPTTASEGRSCGPVVSVTGGTMLNCTVVGRCQCIGTGSSTDGNFTKFDGGSGIYCGSSGWVKNCVSTCVTNANGVVTPFTGTASRFVNCAGDGGTVWGGADCIDGTPEVFFNDLAGRDYLPKMDGPLVNAGAEYDGMSETDLAGKPRKSGKIVDIGCYECQKTPGFYIHVR
jgi:PKD repeat protein